MSVDILFSVFLSVFRSLFDPLFLPIFGIICVICVFRLVHILM